MSIKSFQQNSLKLKAKMISKNQIPKAKRWKRQYKYQDNLKIVKKLKLRPEPYFIFDDYI